MRGKRWETGEVKENLRIIPAHAGQTSCLFHFISFLADHPRACGANSRQRRLLPDESGSSPRMRGKQLDVWQSFQHVRIIPAHAGQTRLYILLISRAPDHPRACGANKAVLLGADWSNGSSPRMRGKPGGLFLNCWQIRIIPAHAGQTRHFGHWRNACPDHPRACGAN